jgi:hypothetical protein
VLVKLKIAATVLALVGIRLLELNLKIAGRKDVGQVEPMMEDMMEGTKLLEKTFLNMEEGLIGNKIALI